MGKAIAHTFGLSRPIRMVRSVFYGWWIVGTSALITAVCGVPFFAGTTAWFVVLREDYSWSVGAMTWAFALTRVEGGLMGPVQGFLTERLGPRRMVLIGLLILGGGFMLFSRINSLWGLYGAFLVMSMGSGLGIWLPTMTAVNNWFVRHRGLAIALAGEGMFVGSVVVLPALVWAIDPDADRFGWRVPAASIGLLIVVLAPVFSRLVRNRPEDYGQHPYGEAPASPAGEQTRTGPAPSSKDEPAFSLHEAIVTPQFWLMAFGHSLLGTVFVSITVHLGIMLQDRDFSLQTVAWVVAIYSGIAAVFSLIGGLIGDRVPMRWAILVFATIQSVSIVVLIQAHTVWMVFLFAILMGIGFGGRNPLTLAIRGVYFGRKSFASILGISMVPMNVLLLITPLFAGYMFDLRGSYTIPFTVIAGMSFLGAGLYVFLGSPEKLMRERARRAESAIRYRRRPTT